MTNLTYKKGDTWNIDITVKDDSGVAVNLTGCTFFLTIKRRYSDTDAQAVLKKDWTDHTSAAEGKTRATITAAVTGALLPGVYVYDIQYLNGSGEVKTILEGRFIISNEVTVRIVAT